jgi:hypothetical protein
MSRRYNLELAGVSTPSDLRQELLREIAALEHDQQQHERIQSRNNNPDHRIDQPDQFQDEPEVNFRRAKILKRIDLLDDSSSSTSSPSRRAISGGLCLEGARADTGLFEAQRMIAREEAILKRVAKSDFEKRRLADQLKIVQERSEWAMALIMKQEREARETMELLAGSQFVETERKERARKYRDKVDAEVEEYLTERQVIDDLHNSMVEDRWLTREKVLREAAAHREAREQVERDWRREKEQVFLDEEDVFLTMN